MTLRHTLAPAIGRLLNQSRRLFGRSDRRFQSILLHDVPPARIERLIALLDFIKREHGFLTPDEAEQRLRGEGPSSKALPCLLTFDDGFASSRHIGLEILSRYGAKAIFFVCPGLIDAAPARQSELVAQNVFRGRAPDPIAPLMTWTDIEALHAAGHTIGAHGMTHRRLSELSGEELCHEVIEAGRRIEERLGAPPRWYAYAFGDADSVNAAAFTVIKRHFPLCRSGVRGLNSGGRLVLGQEVDLAAPPDYQQSVLSGSLDFYHLAARRRLASEWMRSGD